MARDFSDDGSVCVILGDNCTDANITRDVKNFTQGAHIFLKKVPDPQRFGVPSFNRQRKIIKISEKPRKPASDYAVTGLYIYDNKVFDYISQCNPDFIGRGELEITEVNNFYIKAGKLRWQELDGYWRDAGSFRTLFEANEYWAQKPRTT